MSVNENTTATSTHKPRLFRWALWWGLGITVVCFAIFFIDDKANSSLTQPIAPIDNVFNEMIYWVGIWPALIVLGLVGPIVEEVCFRLWGNGKLWTGITSVIFMALLCLPIGWWLSLITIFCGVAILVLFREDKTKRLFALMLLSSILFAVMHMDNYDENEGWFMFLVSIVDKFGFGLVASYLVINHNILWSIGLHVFNNGIIAILMGISFGEVSSTVVTIDNENFRLEVRPVLVHNDSIRQDNRFFFDADTNYYFGNTANFASQAFYYEARQNGIDPTSDTIHFMADNYYPKCKFKLVYKTQPFDHHGLIVAMEKEGLIKIDTTYSSTYEMWIADTSLLSRIQYDSSYVSYKYAGYIVRYSADPPVILGSYDSSLDSLYVKGIDLIRENQNGTQTLEELRQILAPQGIIIEPSKRRMTMLNIKSTYDPWY
jgi:membrane protease YdiL (CAAX protease family)